MLNSYFVKAVWLVDPETNGFDRFQDGELVRRERFELADRFRVADVAILDRDAPYEPIPTTPPLAVFEVLSRRTG